MHSNGCALINGNRGYLLTHLHANIVSLHVIKQTFVASELLTAKIITKQYFENQCSRKLTMSNINDDLFAPEIDNFLLAYSGSILRNFHW